MHEHLTFDRITDLEKQLSEFTGAPYVIATDCCTHAIELALRISPITKVKLTPYTYLSVPMLFHKLLIDYEFVDEEWNNEYQLHGTNIWDSAWLLKPNMYRKDMIQCLSFGHEKPINNKRGGCILLDNKEQYQLLKKMSFDGRDRDVTWLNEQNFVVGFHYNMPIEHAINCSKLLKEYIAKGNYTSKRPNKFPDCRKITIHDPNVLTISK